MPDHFKGTSLKFGKWHSEVIVGTLIYKGGTSSIFIIQSIHSDLDHSVFVLLFEELFLI